MSHPPPQPMYEMVTARVRTFSGLEDCTREQVQAVHEGRDIGDPFKTVAITRELEQYGFTREPRP